jgi:transposase-like protein
MPSWFAIALAVLIVPIGFVIVRSMKSVMSEVRGQMRGTERSRQIAATKEIIQQLKQLDPRCPRCGSDAFLLFGTGNGYKCDSCRHEFTGPRHPRMSAG